MRSDLAIILTARMDSTRLPGKAMMDVNGRPLLYWIMRRLSAIGKVILATTKESSDDTLEALAINSKIPVYRGSTDDVISRIDGALCKYHPNARYVLRGLGDCPFMASEIIERACDVMYKTKSDAFVWTLSPSCFPVYGAREFPYSRDGWNTIVANSGQREHVDAYFHTNRSKFKIIYHEPPGNIYFRPYRLEVDWPEDLQLIRKIASDMSMLSPLPKIISWLDTHGAAAKLNREKVEKTGPSVYEYETYRNWMKTMAGNPIMCWNNKLWEPPSENSTPIFCKSGQCFLGYGHNGILHTKDAIINGNAMLSCSCGSGLNWIKK